MELALHAAAHHPYAARQLMHVPIIMVRVPIILAPRICDLAG
jgi:hypothetical protein